MFTVQKEGLQTITNVLRKLDYPEEIVQKVTKEFEDCPFDTDFDYMQNVGESIGVAARYYGLECSFECGPEGDLVYVNAKMTRTF